MRAAIIYLIISFTLIFSAFPQGADEKEADKNLCIRQYALYKEYQKIEEYQDAKLFWKKMADICPSYSTGVWSDGEKIYKAVIDAEEDPLKKAELIDTLMWIYDQRISYFGDHQRYTKGYILGKKGLAFFEYGVEPEITGYKILKESLELEGVESKPAVILTLMNVTSKMFKTGQINANDVLSNYSECINIVDTNLKNSPNNKRFITAKEGLEQNMITSGAADCSTLIELFTPQFIDNIDNGDWLSKVNQLLKSSGCSDTDLFTKSSEALFKIEPSSELAHKIANIYYTNGDFDSAIKFLFEGVKLGDDSEEKASMYYELAHIHYTQFKEYQNARTYARKASDIRPNWGDPYLLIGRMYIDDRQSVSDQQFEQDAVFWAAVDKFITAKQVDPEQTKKANELIQLYSGHFPVNEDVFMWTLKDGASYHIGGWIDEKTTVRSRKNY